MSGAPRLMLITPREGRHVDLPELATQAVAGGVDAIQLRAPAMNHTERRATAIAIVARLGSPDQLIVNNDLELATELGCGLHLPEQNDRIVEARSLLGGAAIIGRSVHSPESATASAGVDYLVAGHVFATSSKPGLPPIGLNGLAGIVAASPVPVLAVGGITAEHVPAVLAAGAHGVAVISAIAESPSPRTAAATLRHYLELAIKEQSAVSTSESAISTIDLMVNGKSMTLSAGSSIADLLRQRQLDQRLVAIEHNGTILKPDSFASTALDAGDVVEIVQFVGGG